MNETLNSNQPQCEGVLEDDQKQVAAAVTEEKKCEETVTETSEVKEQLTEEKAACTPEVDIPSGDEQTVFPEEEAQSGKIVSETPAQPLEKQTDTIEVKEEEAARDKALIEEEEEGSFLETELPAAEEENDNDENKEKAGYAFRATREEVIERLKEISVAEPQKEDKHEIDILKQNFYKLHKAKLNADRKAFVDGGGQAEEYLPVPDKLEEEFKTVLNVIKEKRSRFQEEEEKIRQQNLAEKLQIIEELKEMVESGNVENNSYNRFRALQQRWKELKELPQNVSNELWKKYQLYIEHFYDILKLNNEFREYDFKKNLEIKTRLCEAAEKLADENDIVAAFRQLQKLHQEWREAGPVGRDLREEIWNRFKIASTLINRKHQQHFEALKETEQVNLDQKTVICEIVEAVEYDKLTNYQSWNDKTKEVIALQAKWKTIGFAPQKMNQKIFERFRAACDEFFKRKGEFFKSIKEGLNENLEKKRALCQKAEELKDSTDWKAASDQFIALQKEWKSIGPVPKKYSDTLWKSFIAYCDYFFEQKGKSTSSQRNTEIANLKQKKTIIAKLRELCTESGEQTDKEKTQAINQLVAEWNSIGHVPFKEKDKIYKEFKAIQDELYGKLHISDTTRRMPSYRGGGIREGESRERERLSRLYESMKTEIMTYENNIGFLTSSSKKGDNLVAEFQQRVEQLKADAESVLRKIKDLDEAEKQ